MQPYFWSEFAVLWSGDSEDWALLSLTAKCHRDTTLAIQLSHFRGHRKPSRNSSTAAPNTCRSIKVWAACRLHRGLICQRHQSFGTRIQFSLVMGLWLMQNNWTCFGSGVWETYIPWTIWWLWCRQTWQYLPDTSQHCLFGFTLTPHSGLSWFLLEMFPIIIRLTLDLKWLLPTDK